MTGTIPEAGSDFFSMEYGLGIFKLHHHMGLLFFTVVMPLVILPTSSIFPPAALLFPG
jgi:hypothetical protein